MWALPYPLHIVLVCMYVHCIVNIHSSSDCMYSSMYRVQNKNSNLVGHVQKMLPCIQSLHSKCTVNVAKVDWPYSEIGRKMANG